MTASFPGTVVFYALAALAVAGALWVAFARNIVHSAFALLATFLGVAGLYVFLAADVVAVVQVLVYVGGVLVLLLFAVMLTARIADANVSNRSLGRFPAVILLLVLGALLALAAIRSPWSRAPTAPATPTAAGLGDALLGPYVLPFEIVSVLLLAALIGAVTLARKPARARTGSAGATTVPAPPTRPEPPTSDPQTAAPPETAP